MITQSTIADWIDQIFREDLLDERKKDKFIFDAPYEKIFHVKSKQELKENIKEFFTVKRKYSKNLPEWF